MNSTIPFRPRLEGDFRARFHLAASKISSDTSQAEIEALVEKELNWVENECFVNLSQRKKYRAVWMLFRDLIRASWKGNYVDGSLEMSLPDVDNLAGTNLSLSDKKSYMRSWMAESRLERIAFGKDFIKRMEEKNALGHSVLDLIADGSNLTQRLLALREGKIKRAVSPYLQLVAEGEKDTFTGLRIADIWRYFRYSWSTPYETTPGRTLQYLVRDACDPNHAIMGIASLENCALQITCRDQYIGWETESYIDSIRKADSDKFAQDCFIKLNELINEGINSIKYNEFCSKKEIENPTPALINKLQQIAIESEEERINSLKDFAEQSEDESLEQIGSLESVSSDALFRRKRSEQLAKLLSAKVAINEVLNSLDFSLSWRKFIETPSGTSSIRTALLVQKNKHIGSSMLELNVCGAIPPYNEILGGKLVALLATSPQVITDYKKRYKKQPSEIASKLKGKEVFKPSDLVYVGTTSLYSVGSSQYNRLKIPGTIIDSDFDIVWKEIGKTFGFGTLHISRETTVRLNEAISQDGYSRINHVFGEGASPKMRLLKKAITELLETNERESTEFSKHAMSRIVYAAFTAKNTREYLMGETDTPEFYFKKDEVAKKTKAIIHYWEERWLKSRLNYEPVYERISTFNKAEFLISNELKEETINSRQQMKEPETSVNDDLNPSDSLSFIRNFYRGNSAFADYLDEKYLKFIHIKTKLDDTIISTLLGGNDVVLTGNPGDGKTHIIRMLLPKIHELSINPVVELDASTKSEDELYLEWKNAREAGRPFVLAINAALLHSIAENKTDDFIQSARNQMANAITFSSDEGPYSGVLVYDLSKRDVLSYEIIKSVIDRMTSDDFFTGCQSCVLHDSCPVLRNRKMIRYELFQERLYSILRRASLTGFHATLRDLQSLSSFLLFEGRKCRDFQSSAGGEEYEVANLLFNGKGNIFNAIRASFDPSQVSHPVWDEMLLSASVPEESWIDESVYSRESLLPTNEGQFRLRKRQFFLFNTHGDELLKIASDDVSRYQEFLKRDDKDKLKEIVQKLNSLFGSNEGPKSLRIWSSHRYNHKPRKMLISTGTISRNRFEIQTPKLLAEMNKGISYESPYVRMCLKDNATIGIKIDFDIYHMLLCNERGLPSLLLESEEVKRIWRFMDLLRSGSEEDDEEKEVIISDLQSNKKATVLIDTDENKYISIK